MIDDVIADVAQNAVRAEDLERVKTQLIAEAIYAQDNQATLARWYGGALTTGLEHRGHQKLAGPDSRRHRRTGPRRRAKMVRQEALGDRLSDQGHHAEARGEAFVTYSLTDHAAPRLHARRRLGDRGLMAPTPSQAATKIQHLISPGGIEAWFVQDATVPLIAMEYAFGGGAAQDPADKPGVGNLVADLLDEGSGDLDSKTFHERLDRRAIELSFSVDAGLFPRQPAHARDNKDEAFDLLRMSLTSPHFDSVDVERIRSQVIVRPEARHLQSERAGRAANSSRSPMATIPTAARPRGTLESVPTITVADMKDYVRRVLAKDTLKIAVVGDIDPASLGKLLDQTFGGLPAKAELVPVPDVVATKPPQRAFIPLDVPQTVVTFGGPGVMRHDPNFMAAYVVNHILGGGTLSSRLYHEVREKRGLAYSVYDSLLWMDHSALFVGNTGTRADRAGETIDAIDKEIRRMAEDGPTATGTGRGQILSQGLADAGARYLLEARIGAAAIPARQAADRLYREAQRHRRCRDAR